MSAAGVADAAWRLCGRDRHGRLRFVRINHRGDAEAVAIADCYFWHGDFEPGSAS